GRVVEGRHAQPVDRRVGGDERDGVAVREEGVVGDRRERRRRGRALLARLLGELRLAHDTIQGPCQRSCPATSASAASGPQVPGAYGWTGGGESSSACMIRHVSSTPSCRVKRVFWPIIAA